MRFEVLELILCPNCRSDLVIENDFINGEYIENGNYKEL